MIAVPTSFKTPKVLIIGTSGMVGMATRDAITQYVGADVVTWNMPSRNEEEKLSKEAERADRIKKYDTLICQKDKTLDGKHAEWLLRGYEPLPKDEQGHVTSVDDIKAALNEGVDCVVITLGLPRKPDEPRDALFSKNAPFFSNTGKEIADFAIAKIKKDPDFHLPVFINIGNPMDTMTEVFGRVLSERMAQGALEAKASGNLLLAKRLADEVKSLRGKIMGQGGVLDGARAAFAVHDATGIPLKNIVKVPVIGTHNDNMVVDLENTEVIHNGNLRLLKDAGVDIKEIEDKVATLTRAGGSNVGKDYKATTGIGQTAFVATAAAAMQMVNAVVHDKQTTLPAALYNIPENTGRFNEKIGEGVVMGQMVTLGKNGVTDVLPFHQSFQEKLRFAREKAKMDVFSAQNIGSAF